MALTNEDLKSIEQMLDHQLDVKLAPMQTEIKELRTHVSEMKKDLRILARIAELDLIKQEKTFNWLTKD